MNTVPLQVLNQKGFTSTLGLGVRSRPLNSSVSSEKEARVISPVDPRRSLETTLQHIFPEKAEDTRILKARRIMGDEIKELSDEDLEVYLTEFQYLIDAWLDDYEKQIFSGVTLQQMLKEG